MSERIDSSPVLKPRLSNAIRLSVSPLNVGLVQFDNGARVLMEFVDVDPKQLRVGLPVRPVFRIKERDLMLHYDRYFWKAAPLDSTEAR